MIEGMEKVNWLQVFSNGLIITFPLLLGGYVAWKRLWWLLGEYRPHAHGEKAGPLAAESIRYPRTMNGKR